MTFGWSQASSPVGQELADVMVEKFLAAEGRHIDAARIYSGGDAEPMLGQALQRAAVQGAEVRLATKAHPSQPGGLSAEGLKAQLASSLEALRVKSIEALYLHQPDPGHDLAESLECAHGLISTGRVRNLGLSNYSAIEVERCCVLCRERGWTQPRLYQGLYNPLNRTVEQELLPVLRSHGIAFIAYNPLAGGLLTGKHRRDGEVLKGRFKDNPNYLPRFYTDANFAAVAGLQEACAARGLSLVEATYAWLLRHSQLDGDLGDGVLLGASSEAQLVENVAACRSAAELPEEVLASFEAAWELCKDGAFPYWRSYSRDQPGRDSLHPGASYEASKK